MNQTTPFFILSERSKTVSGSRPLEPIPIEELKARNKTMKALTTVNNDELTISFPEIREMLGNHIREHLQKRLEADREKFWKEDQKFKMRSECMRKIDQISEEMLSDLAPTVSVDFQRTLRIPDNDEDHCLPPGLGSFPLRHVEDFPHKLPSKWSERGGAMLPIHQSEAMWLSFDCQYPMALKVGTGKVCAISGEDWSDGLSSSPQNYCVLPDQPWLDGYCVEEGVIRQFVAAPLGEGVTVEEQLTGKGEWGGIQIEAWPLNPHIYWVEGLRRRVDESWDWWLREDGKIICASDRGRNYAQESCVCNSPMDEMDMGLAAGGRMKQEIYEDERKPSDYLLCQANRCFVHLCHANQWELTTGQAPPNKPPTSEDYSKHGLPWYDYYDEKQVALSETSKLAGIKSLKTLEEKLEKKILPDTSDKAQPKLIIKYINK